jgi:hypothetical protein
MVATLGIVISLLVLGSPERDFTATAYSDVIRFEAEGVATLQVRIFDLSGKEVWGSGVVSGDTIDWDRRNDTGERLAYGAYIYSAQGWNAQGDLIFQKNGKLALMPGDTVQLQAAPVAIPESTALPLLDISSSLQPKVTYNEDVNVNGDINFLNSSARPRIGLTSDTLGISIQGGSDWHGGAFMEFWGQSQGSIPGYADIAYGGASSNLPSKVRFRYQDTAGLHDRMVIESSGEVGIGTNNPTAKLEIESSTGQDLIAAYNSSNRVFVVTNTGVVRADGAYYSGTGGFNTGGADVAERINVSEWVEKGYVVEIDPDHPGFFRKSSTPYSTKVAGIISTSPGVILGNSFDEATDDWDDNRPVLAVTGRVPCKVSAENGPIQIGDLLISSSTSGVAMKGDPERAIGAVIGKAMEPLQEGTGTIVVQVMLR